MAAAYLGESMEVLGQTPNVNCHEVGIYAIEYDYEASLVNARHRRWHPATSGPKGWFYPELVSESSKATVLGIFSGKDA